MENQIVEMPNTQENSVLNIRKAGRPKGAKNRLTILREKKRIEMETNIAKMTDKLVSSQAIAAIGSYRVVVVTTDAEGKKHLETVKSIKRIDELIAKKEHGKDYMILAGADPDWKAANAMLDRAYGKAKDTLEVQGTFSLLMLGKKAAQVDDELDAAIPANATEVDEDILP